MTKSVEGFHTDLLCGELEARTVQSISEGRDGWELKLSHPSREDYPKIASYSDLSFSITWSVVIALSPWAVNMVFQTELIQSVSAM